MARKHLDVSNSAKRQAGNCTSEHPNTAPGRRACCLDASDREPRLQERVDAGNEHDQRRAFHRHFSLGGPAQDVPSDRLAQVRLDGVEGLVLGIGRGAPGSLSGREYEDARREAERERHG